MTRPDPPRLVFRHLDAEPWREVKAQRHGTRRVSVWEKWLDRSPRLLALYARYDAGMVVERHGHMSDHLVFVLEGEITIGEHRCPAGTHVTLEQGAVFGPIVAGPEGAVLYEVMMGDPRAVPADPDGFRALCAARDVEPLANPPLLRPAWAKTRLD
jgi:ChrR Cupin-like domain